MSYSKDLTDIIEHSYQEGVTMEEAERLAGRFLHAQIQMGEQVRLADLDCRMKKQGLKAVKAAIYLAEVQAADKKPSDVLLQAKVDVNELVAAEQTSFDKAECLLHEMQNLLGVYNQAHVHFRSIAKGAFNG